MENRLKQIRKSLKLTQAQFAERIGVKGNTVACYETGARAMSDVVINSICREYHVSEWWLRYGEGEMFEDRTPDDDLAEDFGRLFAGEDDFKKRWISLLLRMPEEDWKVIQRLVETYAEKYCAEK